MRCYICKRMLLEKEINEGDVCDICWKHHSKTGLSLDEMKKTHKTMREYDAISEEVEK